VFKYLCETAFGRWSLWEAWKFGQLIFEQNRWSKIRECPSCRPTDLLLHERQQEDQLSDQGGHRSCRSSRWASMTAQCTTSTAGSTLDEATSPGAARRLLFGNIVFFVWVMNFRLILFNTVNSRWWIHWKSIIDNSYLGILYDIFSGFLNFILDILWFWNKFCPFYLLAHYHA